MKLLFTTRQSLFSQPGGDTQQVMQTADALRNRGHLVDVVLRGENVDFNEYDLIHFFNLGRPADAEHFIKKLKKPLVVSSIWVDYSEYDAQRTDAVGSIQRKFGTFKTEYAKTLARALKGTDAMPSASYLWRGHQKKMQNIAQRANAIIASSDSEMQRLNAHFATEKKTSIIPLGLPETYWEKVENRKRHDVISVGRIEGLKNQLTLIEAAKNQPWQLTLIGKPAANQQNYFEKCKAAAGYNVKFAGWRDGDHLLEAYQSAKVLVLPSYFETFGLVALEALSQGCQVVLADRPDMNSIFKKYATFCSPNDAQSMRDAVNEALKKPAFSKQEELKKEFSWSEIAAKIERVYENVLSAKA